MLFHNCFNIQAKALLGKLLEVKRIAADLGKEVESLRQTLDAISVIIVDAEERQTDNPIKLWLQHLREQTYNASDVLDEVAYEALRRGHVNFQEVRNSGVSVLSARRLLFSHNISSKITTVKKSLDKLVNESCALNLKKDGGSRNLAQTTSETGSVGEHNVFGRERDSNIMLSYLLSSDWSIGSVDFVAVLGKAGLGKTTLTQLVFGDPRVVEHFDIKLWVHALSILDEKELYKATIASITEEICDIPNLDIMQRRLTNLLERKKYLLVLDGLSNDSPDFLYAVKNFLSCLGAFGSKVLITTQTRSISKLICTNNTHELKRISNSDCANLIRKFAFSDQNPNAVLNSIIDSIVHKCDGSPLAAKKYGHLLSIETEREKWELISRMEVGQVIEHGVTRTLPSNVKRCFAYCSIFPRGFLFDKEQLIQLWLAQDFVQNEDEGDNCFDTMFRCSLFRYAPLDSHHTEERYLMDGDIRSSAQLISGDECFHENSRMLSDIARHASLFLNDNESVAPLLRKSSSSRSRRNVITGIESLYNAKGLYTLILLAHPSNPVRMQIPDNLGEKLKRLRSLDLSNTGIMELPSSIGGLKYLRYLALHNAKVTRLPNSLCELYFLQTLGLRNCYELAKLPKDMRHLTNLRHLDLHLEDSSRHGALTSMPRNIGTLINLRTLSRFVVSAKEGCGIKELKDLEDIRGNLTIFGLEFVNDYVEAREACLDDKEHVRMLELRWDEGERHSRNDTQVLELLKPHVNIKEIRICGYLGYYLCSWIGHSSFSSLSILKISNCMNLSELPPLAGLRVLKKLELENLPNWKTWSGREDRDFPSLQELIIRDCINLYRFCPSVPKLLRLEIERCPRILGLPVFSSLESLKVKGCGDWFWKSVSSLKSISFLSLSGLPSTYTTGLQTCMHLKQLELTNLAQLQYLPDDWLPVTISRFKIEQCPMLQSLPHSVSLQYLQVLQVKRCQELRFLPMGMNTLNSLRYLEFSDCPNLSFARTDGFPDRIQTLIVNNCRMILQVLEQQWDFISYNEIEVWVDGALLSSKEAAYSGSSSNPRQ